jgi:two-component system, LytTR family, sensor kinase
LIHVILTPLLAGPVAEKRLSLGEILQYLPKFAATNLDREVSLYLIIVLVTSAYGYYSRFRERERRTAALELEQARLQASLNQAQLESLRRQLQPHFLFNSLHALSTLILKGENETANRMLHRLSGFLRMTLENEGEPEVPLSRELEFLDSYLEIQRVRFGDRLEVDLDIQEETRAALVPNLILQPLVENAIRHGIAARPGRGWIRIRSRREGRDLRLEVKDNGVGLEGSNNVEGVGLSNIRARLAQLYPGRHNLTLETSGRSGAVATVTLPLRTAPPGEARDPARS